MVMLLRKEAVENPLFSQLVRGMTEEAAQRILYFKADLDNADTDRLEERLDSKRRRCGNSAELVRIEIGNFLSDLFFERIGKTVVVASEWISGDGNVTYETFFEGKPRTERVQSKIMIDRVYEFKNGTGNTQYAVSKSRGGSSAFSKKSARYLQASRFLSERNRLTDIENLFLVSASTIATALRYEKSNKSVMPDHPQKRVLIYGNTQEEIRNFAQKLVPGYRG